MNVMSAFFAAVAVGLCSLILSRLGCRPAVAAAAALSLAFDHCLWSKAVHAEVYSLGGALVAAIVYCAVRWQATRRDRDLYLMVAMFAVSLGNHLTVTTLVPGLILFVLVADRHAIRTRTIAVSAVIVLAGIAQYGFIVLRTLQHAPYLEAQATNLRELLSVMRASKYSYQMFAFSPYQLLVERVPQWWHLSVVELGALGTLLWAVGLVVLAARRIPIGVLLVLGAAGITFLTLNVDADVEGFLVPAFVLTWIVVGLGLEAVWQRLDAAKPLAAVAVAAALALPSIQLARNYRGNDHHARTYETRYFNAMFAALEPRAAIVRESYAVDQLLLYKLIGERAARDRGIEMISKESDVVKERVARRSPVYAFSESRSALESSGFKFEPVQLRDSSSGRIDMTPMPLFRLVRAPVCHDVGNTGWQDVSDAARDGRLVLRIDNYRPFDATVVIYIANDAMASGVPMLAASQGPGIPTLSVRSFAGRDDPDLMAALERDTMTLRAGLLRHGTIRRLELRVNDLGQFSWSALDLRDAPVVAVIRASVDLDNPRRASVCSWSGRDFFETSNEQHLSFAPQGDVSFGRGWHAAEYSNEGVAFRWTGEREAEVLVPLLRVGDMKLRLRAYPFTYPHAPAQSLVVSVNGVARPAQPVAPDWKVYVWNLPADLWHAGFNRLTIGTPNVTSPASVGLSNDSRQLGVAVSELTLQLQPVSATGTGH
jgi:hypothetical protein